MKLRVLLLEKIHPRAAEIFAAAKLQVQQISEALTSEELAEMDWDILGIRSSTQIERKLFDRKQRLAIGAFCIGTNQIDLDACGNFGCAVFHDRYSNGRSVAELCLTNLGALFRNLPYQNKLAHAGAWLKGSNGSRVMLGKTLGIVGYGNIGRQVGALAESIGMKVVFYDLRKQPALGNARACGSLEELLNEADAVTLHVDGRVENRQLFDKKMIRQMKQGAFLLNSSRGYVVVEEDLAAALRGGHIAGAALDVHENEPADNRVPFQSALRGMDNVILTPHIAGSTEEAQAAIAENMAERLLNYIQSGAIESSPLFPDHVIGNMPKDASRIIYIHQNVPGQIASASGVLADHNVNITAQHLITNERVGYASFDTAKMPVSKLRKVESSLKGVEGFIKVRTL